MRQLDDPEVNAWVDKAEEDLAVATVLVQHAPHLAAAVGFHSQQTSEKYLKAILVAIDVTVPRTHDQNVLLASAVESFLHLDELQEAASRLTGFAVVPRCPSLLSWASEVSDVSNKCLRYAQTFRSAVRSTVPGRLAVRQSTGSGERQARGACSERGIP